MEGVSKHPTTHHQCIAFSRVLLNRILTVDKFLLCLSQRLERRCRGMDEWPVASCPHFLELDDVGPFDLSSKVIGIVFGIANGLGEFQLRLNIFVLHFDLFFSLDQFCCTVYVE